MKRIISTAVVLFWTVLAFAQGSLLKQFLEIAEVEVNDGEITLSVFDIPEDGQHQYFLSVGTLGFGDEIIQFNIDPVSQLFIPLGGTLDEVQEKLDEFNVVGKASSGTELETVGILAIDPSMGEPEPVYVTSRRFLFQKLISFSIKREGYVRASNIPRGDFGSLITLVQFYRKVHPNEP